MSSGVEFESDSTGYSRPRQSIPGSSGMVPNSGLPGGTESHSAMTRFLIRHGLAKSPETAQAILIGVSIFNFILTVFVTIFLIF